MLTKYDSSLHQEMSYFCNKEELTDETQAYCTFANTSLLVLGGPFRTCSSSFSISLLMSSRSSLG